MGSKQPSHKSAKADEPTVLEILEKIEKMAGQALAELKGLDDAEGTRDRIQREQE